jgi:F-type H+-transporting ATPase subunit b
MSAVQEVLTVLLGAESEAKRVVEEAKRESASVVRTTQDIFIPNRENRMSSVREQAKGLMQNALNGAEAEARQILEFGKEERERINKRFEENVDAVVASVLAETVDGILAGGE